MLKVVKPFTVFNKEYSVGDTASPADLGIYANDIVEAGCLSALDTVPFITDEQPTEIKSNRKSPKDSAL